MFDAETIRQLQKSDAISTAEDSLMRALNGTLNAGKNTGAAALPNDFTVHDLERYMPARRRQRAAVNTTSLKGFACYVESQAETGAMVFVDADQMRAQAVLNAGTPETPGHADHICTFAPNKTAAWAALSKILGQRLNQRTLAEFFEDWAPFFVRVMSAPGGDDIALPRAISALRKVTIEAIRKAETAQGQLSESASTFESISASSTETLPGWTVFECAPYADLEPRRFELRLSILTGEKEPQLTLRLAKAEQHAQEMGQELMALCRSALQDYDIRCVLGQYSKAA